MVPTDFAGTSNEHELNENGRSCNTAMYNTKNYPSHARKLGCWKPSNGELSERIRREHTTNRFDRSTNGSGKTRMARLVVQTNVSARQKNVPERLSQLDFQDSRLCLASSFAPTLYQCYGDGPAPGTGPSRNFTGSLTSLSCSAFSHIENGVMLLLLLCHRSWKCKRRKYVYLT